MSLPEHPTGAEEFLDAQIQIAEITPAIERAVHDALDARPGVGRVTIDGEVVTILYDVTLDTKDALVQALTDAGIRVQHAETHRESPIAEIEDQVQPFLDQGTGPDVDR